MSGRALSVTSSRGLSFPNWKNNLTWTFHLSLAEVYCPCVLFLLYYCLPSLKNGFLCSLCSPGYPVCAVSLANFLCSAHFLPSVTNLQELPLHEEWSARQQWDHHLFSDLLSLKFHTHEVKGFHASLIHVLVFCWKVLLFFYKCYSSSIKLSFFQTRLPNG